MPVVAETDVASYLLAYLIESLTHDTEVLLGSKSTAKAFGSCTIRYVVKKTLTGGTDNSDDICTLAGTSLCLYHVLVDVTCSHNDVEIRLGTFTNCVDIVLSTLTTGANLGDGCVDRGSWRIIYVVLMVFSAVITPDASPVTMLLLFIALVLLYEISLLFSRIVLAKKIKREKEEERELIGEDD